MNIGTQKLRNSGVPRSGFTIVELLMVIAIISVLITITVSAVASSMKSARSQRATALCRIVEQGIETYYTQKGEWPVSPGNADTTTRNYTFSGPEVQKMIKTVVEETRKANPMLDVSGLFVSRSTGEPGTRGHGMDFMTAIHGSKQDRKKLKLAQMYFGYPDPKTGYFRRFKITYHPLADTVSVSLQ